jgi:uncharacterized membrane protein required for colicin V production
MWLDLAALVIVAAALAVGAVRGLLVSGVHLVGAAAAWLGAFWLAPALAPRIEAAFGFSGVLAVLAGGLAALFALLLLLELATAVARAVDRRRLAGGSRGRADRVGGALVAGVSGFAFALLVGWLAVSVDVLRVRSESTSLPSTEGSRFAPIVRGAVRGAGEWALADRGPAGIALARAAADPAATMARVERLLANPHLVGLKEDAVFWQQVEAGRHATAVTRASFLALAYDGTTRRELAELGLIDERAAESSQAFRESAVDALAALGPRLRAVRQDPALARLSEDPEVQEMVLANDGLGLLRHPDVRSVIARALSGPPRG